MIRKKPTAGVFASKAHKSKELTIVPAVPSVAVANIPAGSPPPLFHMKLGKTILQMHKPVKHVSMVFHVRSSHNAEECNCAIKKLKSEQGDYSSIIECTVIYNTKKIAAGDELVLYRETPAMASKPKSVVIVNLDSASEPPSKRPKGSLA